MDYVFAWLFFGIVSAAIAWHRGSSTVAFFIVGLLLGPIGILIAWLFTGTRCPTCRRKISASATTCRYCRDQPLSPDNSYRP